MMSLRRAIVSHLLVSRRSTRRKARVWWAFQLWSIERQLLLPLIDTWWRNEAMSTYATRFKEYTRHSLLRLMIACRTYDTYIVTLHLFEFLPVRDMITITKMIIITYYRHLMRRDTHYYRLLPVNALSSWVNSQRRNSPFIVIYCCLLFRCSYGHE